MKKTNLDINQLVKKVIEESLQEKAEELTSKVRGKMEEWDQQVTINPMRDDISEEDEIEKRFCDEDSEEYDEERCEYNKKAKMSGSENELEEELHGGQKKLDINKNGKLDSQDFKMLRKGKKSEGNEQFESHRDEEDNWEEEMFEPKRKKRGDEDRYTAFDKLRMGQEPEDIEWEEIDSEDIDEEMEEGNEFTGALAKAKEKGEKEFEVGGKRFPVKESKKKVDEKWKGDIKVKQTGQYADMTISQIDAAIKKLKDKNEKTKEAGKKVSDTDRTKMSQLYFAKRAKKDWPGKGKTAVKESIQLTEDEMIDLIQKIVEQEKKYAGSKPKGLSQTEKVLSGNKKENDEYIKSVTKKLTDYLKDGSKGKYETEPKIFPSSNGKLAKMDKKAYTPSDAVDEYIEAFAYPGQTNLVYDEIKPDDEKIEMHLKGNSKTGNAIKDKDGKAYGNVVDSEVGERFMKNYEDNLYGAEQMDASYKRQPQPVDIAGETKVKGKLSTIRKKKADKAQKVLDKIEESTTKDEKILSEEFKRISQLIDYSKKSQ